MAANFAEETIHCRACTIYLAQIHKKTKKTSSAVQCVKCKITFAQTL